MPLYRTGRKFFVGVTFQVIAGKKQSIVGGADFVAFGRTWRDWRTLYSTTTGGIVVPPRSGIVGGKVGALDTQQLMH